MIPLYQVTNCSHIFTCRTHSRI